MKIKKAGVNKKKSGVFNKKSGGYIKNSINLLYTIIKSNIITIISQKKIFLKIFAKLRICEIAKIHIFIIFYIFFETRNEIFAISQIKFLCI